MMLRRPPGPVPMQRLSSDGPALSRIVAGAWRLADWDFSVDQRLAWMLTCVDLGITSFDHADVYGDYRGESLFGEALARVPGLRARLQLVTKCGIRLPSPQRPEHRLKSYDSSAAHVVASVERSLQALRTDRIDLLLIHRPDALMDADALAACLDGLRRAGKVLHFGASNFAPSRFALLHRRLRLATHQVEFSALQPQALDDGTLDQCQDLRLAPMAWSPLAGGRLMHGSDDEARRVRAVLERIARERGSAPASVAFAWLLRHPSRPLPIVGSRHAERLRDAADACAIELDAQDWYEIRSAAAGRELP